jgi:hypothetical protein
MAGSALATANQSLSCGGRRGGGWGRAAAGVGGESWPLHHARPARARRASWRRPCSEPGRLLSCWALPRRPRTSKGPVRGSWWLLCRAQPGAKSCLRRSGAGREVRWSAGEAAAAAIPRRCCRRRCSSSPSPAPARGRGARTTAPCGRSAPTSPCPARRPLRAQACTPCRACRGWAEGGRSVARARRAQRGRRAPPPRPPAAACAAADPRTPGPRPAARGPRPAARRPPPVAHQGKGLPSAMCTAKRQ